MARSHGHVAVAAILGAVCYALLGELPAFVNTAASSHSLRSRVSLAATKAEVEAAKKDFELKKWAAGHLASEGSAQAAAAAAKAQQAESTYLTLKAQLEGQAPPPPPLVAAAPVAAAPVAAAPVAATAPAGAVSKEDLAAVKSSAQLLTWAANKLASEGAPQAAAMKVKADQAVAAFEAMKQAQASGAAMPAAAPAMPTVAAAPVAAALVAAAPAAGAVSKEELAAAKQNAQLLTWSYNKLASDGAPQAAAMKVKADQAVAAFEALKQAQASGAAAPAAAAPVAAAPVAPTPVAAAPVVSSAPSADELLKAKKEMELHEWAAKSLAASGSLQATVMKTKAEQSRQKYEALKAAQEGQLVSR